MLNYEFQSEIYNPVVPAGVWCYISSRLIVNSNPCSACEIWMKVDEEWVKSTLTYDNGFFWFWFRARMGIYRIKFIAYRVRMFDREYVLESPEYKIIVKPKLFNFSPLRYEVKVFRKITLWEAYSKLRYIKQKYFPRSRMYIVGRLSRNGYSFHDVDVYIVPMPENVEEIKVKLRKITLLPIDIRYPRKNESMVEVF